MKEFIKLMRPQQWFKSLSILFSVSVVFFLEGFMFEKLYKVVLAFFAVSFLSSIVYIFNDIADKDKDKLHPIKKNRPIASGKISVKKAIIQGIILLIISGIIFYYLNPFLLIIAGLMLVNNLIYSFKPFRFKDYPILDVLVAALNFSLRVLIGWYVLTLRPIYFIIVLFPFFIAGFLLSCKRLAELKFLGEKKAEKVRKVFEFYEEKSLNISINVYFTLSILGYYFFANIFNKNLFFVGPWFFLQMYWYKQFLGEKASVVKRPEDVFLNKKIFTLSGLLFCISFLLIILFS